MDRREWYKLWRRICAWIGLVLLAAYIPGLSAMVRFWSVVAVTFLLIASFLFIIWDNE